MKSLVFFNILVAWFLVSFAERTPVDFDRVDILIVDDLPVTFDFEVVENETRDERIHRLAYKYAVPQQLAALVYQYETSSGANVKSRFEKHVPAWLLDKKRPPNFRAAVKKFATTKDRMKILASSHGSLQVMGYHALSYGIDPIELANNELLADELAMVRLANAWHSSKGPKYQRAKTTGKKYNGSAKYAARLASDFTKGVKYS